MDQRVLLLRLTLSPSMRTVVRHRCLSLRYQCRFLNSLTTRAFVRKGKDFLCCALSFSLNSNLVGLFFIFFYFCESACTLLIATASRGTSGVPGVAGFVELLQSVFIWGSILINS